MSGAGTALLQEVGYWSVTRTSSGTRVQDGSPGIGRLDPRSLVDAEWRESLLARNVARYLRAGMLESYEMGYSWCRFDCGTGGRELGCCNLTDGVFVWPEGLVHYVSVHSVKPPQQFLDHVLAVLGPGAAAAEVDVPCRNALRWEPGTGTVAMDPGTRELLQRDSTLIL